MSEVLVHTNIAVWWRVRGKNRLDGLERRALQGQAALLARLIDTLAQHAAQRHIDGRHGYNTALRLSSNHSGQHKQPRKCCEACAAKLPVSRSRLQCVRETPAKPKVKL